MTSSKRPADASMDLAAKKPKKNAVERSVIDIDPYGDLYIHPGADGSAKTMSVVRVNSALLIAVSPVFRVMLGPNFREGRSTYSATDPLQLPEDESDAMINMLRLIHYRSKDMVKNSKWLVRLFLVCDKYQVAESFQDFFRLHIRLADAMVGAGQVELCIIAAFVGLEEEFSSKCKSLATETKDRVIAFCDKDLLALLPSDLLDHMIVLRKRAHANNIVAANTFIESLSKRNGVCDGVIQCIGKWVHTLTADVYRSETGDLPLFDLAKFLNSLRKTEFREAMYAMKCKTQRKCKSCGQEKKIEWAINHVAAMADVSPIGARLCYKCFRSGKVGLEDECSGHELVSTSPTIEPLQ